MARRTDLLDNENIDLTVDHFWEILSEDYSNGKVNFQYGNDPYNCGDTMIIFDGWDELENTKAILNGWEGGEIAVHFRHNELSEEITKAKRDLLAVWHEETKKDSWKIDRARKSLVKLQNLYLYHKWLKDNDYEEKDFSDFGIEEGFSDEYTNCYSNGGGCNNIIRTSPDSYHWTAPYFSESECCYVCQECVDSGDYDEEILEEYKNEERSIPDDFDLNRLGLVKINDRSYENGLHYGMDDSPKPIIEKFEDAGIDIWFKVYPSQFYAEFDVLVREEDEEKAKELLEDTDTYQGYSTAGNCEKALKEATIKMNELKGNGIKCASCNSDGTADVKLVSQEDFIKGIK